MKVWIDVTSLPHVHFFRALVRKLEKDGNDILVTSREFGVMNDILEKDGIEYISVGKHGGKGLEGKLLSSSHRTTELTKLISKEKPDAGISKHSIECTRVCFGLGIPSITVIDHETAEMQTRLIAPISDTVLSPEATPRKPLRECGARKIETFQGVCETAHFNDFIPSKDVLKEIGLKEKDKIVIARPEPKLSAHNFHESLLFPAMEYIDNNFDVSTVFIPRNSSDRKMAEKTQAIIPEEPIDTLSLYSYASLMLGAGSCMNRESCIGGCPTISICPDRLPGVDKFLIDRGIMHHSLDSSEINKMVSDILDGKRGNREKFSSGEFEDPHHKIMKLLQKSEE